jgi:hypothetical protein
MKYNIDSLKLKYRRQVIITVLVLGLSLFYNVTDLLAQTIIVTVDLELNALPDEKREKLTNFKQVLEDYLNNFKWTENEFGGEFKINLNMLFQDISVSFEDRYKVQLLISNNSDVQYSDKRCRLEYQKGEIPNHSDNNWDSLTSLLDFFMNIIIGEEMDKFGHLLGSRYFERAKLIAEHARFGMGQFIDGWDLRVDLINYILGDTNTKFREMKDFYFYGLYFAKDDPSKARTYCKEAINMLEEIIAKEDTKFKKCDRFIEAHYIEIVELFKNSGDRKVFETMIKLDPPRENIYKELL